MTKLLIVDDEPDVVSLIKQLLRRKIQEGAYEVRFAGGGREALAMIQAEPDYDILLVDINMPDMDGLTLLTHLPTLLPNGRAVMVSAYGDMNNIRAAMNRGAFDFVCKPINPADLERTLQKTEQHVGQLRHSAQMQALAELKTRLFDNIAHEFRTPLSLILSPAERLLRDWTDTHGSNRDVLAIERNARHLLRLINQLLDLAKLEAGQLRVNPQVGNLNEFIDQLVQAFVPLAEQQGIRLTYDSDLTGTWLFDAEKVGQIAYNLIANAIKFTAGRGTLAGPTGAVAVRLLAGNHPRLVIADNGIGIAPDQLPHIFDRFYQGDPSSQRVQPGTGIGLSLVNELVELMGGTIAVESPNGTDTSGLGTLATGTTFTVELPLMVSPSSEAVDTYALSFWSWFALPPLDHSTTLPLPPADAPLVIVVEDNAELRHFLESELTGPYRVKTASTGEEGWQRIQDELPDVVISDVMMPGLDGYELTNRIRNTAATDHIAVVLLTAKATPSSRIEGLQRGADDYLTKPFQVEELQLRLRNLTHRQQRLRTLYQQQLAQPSLPQPLETVQAGWLRTLYTVLEAHLDDSGLSVEQLASLMAMSSKTLLRKVTALTQLSTNELIRQYRLRRGADLLRAGHGVAETAYMVGFETPSYFGQCFKEFFQATPRDFQLANGLHASHFPPV